MGSLTVKRHRPLQWSLAVVLLSMFIASLTWLLLDNSHWSLIRDRFQSNREYRQVWEMNRDLQRQNRELQEQVLMMERTASIDRETMAQMQDEMRAIQDEIYQLKGELEFYQGIMDATRQVSGLNVQGIHVEPLARVRCYRIKLVLTHVTKNVTVAEGSMQVAIEGELDGDLEKLDLNQVTLDDELELSFQFRNFKRFESDLELPPGFVPRRVLVRLQPDESGQALISRIFDWPVTAIAGAL